MVIIKRNNRIRFLTIFVAVIVFFTVLGGCGGLATLNDEEPLNLAYNSSDYYDPYKDYSVGDRFLFGSYEQDNNTDNGKEYIQWRVLSVESGRILVISDFGLDYKTYDDNGDILLEWGNSDLREWLNNGFLSEAFSNEEQEKILFSPILNKAVLSYDDTTRDRIFCLSDQEASELFASQSDLVCQPTEYALNKVKNKWLNGSKYHWWLRSCGSSHSSVAYVQSDGVINTNGVSSDMDVVCVRPAFYIKRAKEDSVLNVYRRTESQYFNSETNYAVGDCFLMGSYEQDGDSSNGDEAIEWQIIGKEDGKLLVLSKYGIDSVFFNPDDFAIGLDWSTCYLRTWLSDIFIHNAFTEDEASLILMSDVENIGNVRNGVSGGQNTKDKLFCLSVEEVIYYFPLDENIAIQAYLEGKNDYEVHIEQIAYRICEPTEYTHNKCKSIDSEYDKDGHEWWLRTPGISTAFAETVSGEGDVSAYYSGRFVDTETIMVRPAFCIECSSNDFAE